MADRGTLEESNYMTKGTEATEGATSEAQPPPYDAGGFSYGAQNYGAENYGAPPHGAQPYGAQPYGAQNYGVAGQLVNYTYGMQDPNIVPINQQPGVGGPVLVGAIPAQGYVIQPVMDMAKPPSYLALSCIVFWLVNLCFGAVAMGFSFSSQSAADRGDMVSARSHGGMAKKLSIAGAVFTIAFITTFLIVFFAI